MFEISVATEQLRKAKKSRQDCFAALGKFVVALRESGMSRPRAALVEKMVTTAIELEWYWAIENASQNAGREEVGKILDSLMGEVG